MRQVINRIVMVLSGTLFCLIVYAGFVTFSDSDVLQVTFLSVGQGDAIFIETPNKVQVLIDTGPDETVLRALGQEMHFYDHAIDIVITTHPDLDHIGGTPEILKRFAVTKYITSSTTKENAVTDAIATHVDRIILKSGDRIMLDPERNIYMDILFPDGIYQTSESNDQSLVTRLVYGDTSFLFTGDASKSVEKYLIDYFHDYVDVDVLKAGHHGSRTSSSQEFLEKTSPSFVVISAGEGNRYGHPHDEVIDRIKTVADQILYTANGPVTFYSDGTHISTH